MVDLWFGGSDIVHIPNLHLVQDFGIEYIELYLPMYTNINVYVYTYTIL